MIWIILGIVAVLLIVIFAIYNKLVRKRNRVQQSEGDIDVQLKRRYDLIPQLVNTVKGYAKHERETLDAVVKARADAMNQASGVSAQGRAAENILEGALKSLFALSESYPDLKASENFAKLQEDLTLTEDKIQAARRFYNNSLREYNDARQLWPAVMFASMFGFKNIGEYFEANQIESQPVEVSF